MKIGERVLLPAVRGAGTDELIVADGFSCRSQIEHATGRRALHTAEVLQLALGRSRAARERTDLAYAEPPRRKRHRTLVPSAALLAAGGYLAWRSTRERHAPAR